MAKQRGDNNPDGDIFGIIKAWSKNNIEWKVIVSDTEPARVDFASHTIIVPPANTPGNMAIRLHEAIKVIEGRQKISSEYSTSLEDFRLDSLIHEYGLDVSKRNDDAQLNKLPDPQNLNEAIQEWFYTAASACSLESLTKGQPEIREDAPQELQDYWEKINDYIPENTKQGLHNIASELATTPTSKKREEVIQKLVKLAGGGPGKDGLSSDSAAQENAKEEDTTKAKQGQEGETKPGNQDKAKQDQEDSSENTEDKSAQEQDAQPGDSDSADQSQPQPGQGEPGEGQPQAGQGQPSPDSQASPQPAQEGQSGAPEGESNAEEAEGKQTDSSEAATKEPQASESQDAPSASGDANKEPQEKDLKDVEYKVNRESPSGTPKNQGEAKQADENDKTNDTPKQGDDAITTGSGGEASIAENTDPEAARRKEEMRRKLIMAATDIRNKAKIEEQKRQDNFERLMAMAKAEKSKVSEHKIGDMEVHTHIARGVKSRAMRRPSGAVDKGQIPVVWERYAEDMAVFQRRRPGGSIVIDCSGSMSWNWDTLMKAMEKFPSMTIGIYSGSNAGLGPGMSGRLCIIADQGRWANIEPREIGNGNDVDIESLEWLAKTKQPRVWLSDGEACGGRVEERGGHDKLRKVAKDAKIVRIADIAGVLEYLRYGGQRKTKGSLTADNPAFVPRDFDYSSYAHGYDEYEDDGLGF